MLAVEEAEGRRGQRDALEGARRTARRIADVADILVVGWLAAFAFSVANSPKDKVDRVAAVWLYALAGLVAAGLFAMILSLVMPALRRKKPLRQDADPR